MIPKKCFFTKGVGVHKEKLASFELALRSAGLAYCNLVLVSSIYPPGCKRISKEEGIKLLRPGETFRNISPSVKPRKKPASIPRISQRACWLRRSASSSIPIPRGMNVKTFSRCQVRSSGRRISRSPRSATKTGFGQPSSRPAPLSTTTETVRPPSYSPSSMRFMRSRAA